MIPVNIYTYTTVKGLRKRSGAAWYILETITSKGEATIGDKIELEEMTENQAELTTLLTAVRRLKGTGEVHIYTDSTFAAAGWRSGWIEGWKKKDWKTKKGEPVAFMEMWQELDEILSAHEVTFHIKEKHSYSTWFEFESKTEKEKKSCTTDSENSTQHKKSTKQQSASEKKETESL